MAHVAILSPEDAGHLIPLGSLGQELVRRGHRVTVLSTTGAGVLAGQMGLPWRELSVEGIPFRLNIPMWLAFQTVQWGWKAAMRASFVRGAEAVLERAPRLLEELSPDVFVIDEIRSAGGTVAEHLGLPFVTVSSALMWHEEPLLPPPFTGWAPEKDRVALLRNRAGYASWHWFMAPAIARINRYRRRWGLPAFRRPDDTHSPLAHLAQSCAEFDYPRTELPDTFHYVGSLGAHRQNGNDHGFPWNRLDGRPLVFASMGTMAGRDNLPVLRRVAAACAGLDVQLVVALGQWKPLLDRAALLLTHAGLNTTLEALARGVPMVAMPRHSDQPGVAARVEYAGAGLRQPFRGGTVAELRGAIERVLQEEPFRERARALQRALIATGGVARAAEIVEQVAATRRPVGRDRCCSENDSALASARETPAGLPGR
jgi:UDP:flavonoid glycosyltransferase YjiC (YdhE family)